MRRSSLVLIPFLLILMLFLTAQGGPANDVSFTHGVASGDVRPFSAVLWTRVDQQALLDVEVSSSPDFDSIAFERSVEATGEDDFTARVVAAPLMPDQTYYYRWRHDDVTSEVGVFKTAPLPILPADVRFTYSGDSDGTRVDGVRPKGDFLALDRAREEEPDFFIYLGDTIYADSSLMDGDAKTLDEYRAKYKENREVAALIDLLKSTSAYAIWDDHEVHDNFAGQTVDPERYAAGREAFLEYMPLRKIVPRDPDCAGDPLFRVFHWGKDVDVIILDERSCRSASAQDSCMNEIAPGEFLEDLIPTMPVGLRKLLRLFVPDDFKPLLPPSPPPGCLEAIYDPDRTMLGDVQKALLKAALRNSDARFKFIVNEVPIQQIYALPYDRWEDYGAERAEILRFIRNNGIDNVIFLTTDIHANLINEVSIDRFFSPRPIAHEFVTGPIGTETLEQNVKGFFGDEFEELAIATFNLLLDIAGVDCRELDLYSYALVKVDASDGTATITLKDEDGQVILNRGSLLNPDPVPCTMTIGP